MLPVVLVHTGFVLALLGLVSLVKPLSFLRLRSRGRGASILGVGFVFVVAGMVLPAQETRMSSLQAQLDQFVPAFQFHEFHSIRVAAPRERVYQAIKQVTADEILFFRTLTWIRRFGRPGPESVLNAPEKLPILDVATRTTFLVLAEEPGREIVVGTVVVAPPGWPSSKLTPEDFKTLRAPGFALAAMNFQVEDEGSGVCVVTTETRVYATDAASRRRFARYWRVIYPGSAFIRRMWLRAVKRRAEGTPG